MDIYIMYGTDGAHFFSKKFCLLWTEYATHGPKQSLSKMYSYSLQKKKKCNFTIFPMQTSLGIAYLWC